MNKLQRICAWCKSEINDDNSRGRQLTDEEYTATSKAATHGKCLECVAKEFAELPPNAHKFSAKIDEANDGVSGGGSRKEEVQELCQTQTSA